MSAELRMGNFDRIMTISLGGHSGIIKKELECSESGFHFFVEIDITYNIAKPETIYLDNIKNPFIHIQFALKDIESDLANQFSYFDESKLKIEINRYISNKLEDIHYLQCLYTCSITLDNEAKKIVKKRQELEVRKHDHEVMLEENDLITLEKQNKIQNDHDLKMIEMENQLESDRKQKESEDFKIGAFEERLNKFGEKIGLYTDHINGGLSGEELTEKLILNKNEDAMLKFNMLMQMHEKNLLNEETLGQILPSLLITNEASKNAKFENVKNISKNDGKLDKETEEFNSEVVNDEVL